LKFPQIFSAQAIAATVKADRRASVTREMVLAGIRLEGSVESKINGWNVARVGEPGEEGCLWLDIISFVPDYR